MVSLLRISSESPNPPEFDSGAVKIGGHARDFTRCGETEQPETARSGSGHGVWYDEPDAVSNAIGYAKFFSRLHDAVIRVYDEAGNVIETHEHAGDFKDF